MAKVTIIPMQRHINNGETIVREFIKYKDALNYFLEWCDERSIPYEYNDYKEGEEMEAGGIGYDYRIELNNT